MHRHGAKSAIARVVLSEVSEDGAVAEITLVDAVGRTVAELQRLGLRRANLALIGREATAAPPAFFALDWREVPAPARAAVSGRWLIVAEPDDDTARALVLALRGSGAECDQIALSELARAHHAEHVVCVWGVESEPDGALRAAQRGLQTIQAVLTIKPAPRLYWITRAATAVVEGDLPAPAAAALWGLGRTVTAEHPELHLSLIDLDPRAVAAEVFLRELGANDDDNEVAWRRGKRHVARLVRAPRAISSTDNYQLATQDKGVLDSLALVPIQRDAPGPGEVQIEVAASGLNFRDVLNALGMYPGEAGPLGNECSGLVVEVGSAVEGFAVGDRVMALAPGAFRRFVTVDARLVSAIPAGFSFEQAAGVPLVFLTAWYALHDLAQLQPGERLLVHAAAGGVGMAAVQIAQQIGAELLATASPAKWDAVRAMGVEHVASSRELGFADVFRAARGGADVVLNALTGSFIDDSLSLLSPGGRFIEMGKAEIRDADAVAAEHPGVAYRAFDLSEAGPDRIAEMFRELNAGFASGLLRPLPLRTFALSEAETAFRFMAQAKHVGKVVLRAAASARQTDASVLITGGLGALGLEVARHLASHGYRHLVLTSRRGLDTYGAPEAVAALEALGARVTVAAVDATDREGLAALLATLPQEYPLRGVVHAAGLIDDGLLEEQTPARFERVISPKVIGAWNLHELTRELDFFVLFSSMAGTRGSAGQGAYAAANAALDALAARRRAHSLPATSLAWGPWAERGMAASLDARLQVRFARQGISLLTPAQGVALFDAALSRSEAHLLVVPLDLRRAAKVFDGDVPPLWRALVRMTAASTPVEQASWAREIAALPEQARLGAVSEMIRGELARVLSLASPDLVPLERPLQELGLDSLMAVELRNALSRRTGVALSATLAFDYPTPQAIGKFILGQLSADEMPALPALPAFAVGEDEPIAIVGIGCRFPGGVTDPDSFWQLLEQGVDAVTEIPKDRWDIDEWYDPDPDAPGKMITRWGAFLDHIDEFDPAFFGISPREAASVDPQERLLLETTWEALEHAGIRPDSLMDSNTGVYMGLCGNEYQGRVVADVQAMDAYGMLGTMHSTMVGRLSYWLGLKGPNLPVDTACSSSLVAIHLAAQALRTGECHLALAGGANVLLGPEGMVYFSRVRAMSPTGRCHTFSADADGYVRAEGAGVVVLERLSDARRKGHRILSILRATAVNQDGRSNGLTAPNGPSQQAVIREALQRGGIAPADVGYVECHGTGTPLGDPIEVQALAAVLGDGRDPGRPVLLSSLKSNLGHMEGAAGVGGLIKAVLALQHGRIPKSLHFNEPNPHIDWKSLPVQVAAEALDWPRNGKPRIAGVSSFGISGTNAHALLEEPPAAQPLFVAPARSAELVV
ncbi:MAG: SDR family NAD(P)-dependent oxidoreductase, partial [Polyangiaceae bacterium]